MKNPAIIPLNRCLCILFIILNFYSKALDKPIRILASPVLEGPIIGVGASQVVNLNIPSATEFDAQSVGMVKLSVLPNKTNYFVTPTDVDVTIQIRIFDNTVNGSFSNPISQISKTLKIRHQPYLNTPYKDQDYLIFDTPNFPKIYRIETSITGIMLNGITPASQLPANVKLESSIDYLRYGDFSESFAGLAITATAADLDCNSINESLILSWVPASGSTYYEIEYCMISNYNSSNLSSVSNPAASDFFVHNSTRIVTKDNVYILPNIFSRGVLKFRYRCFGRQVPNPMSSLVLSPEVAGNWSPETTVLPSHFESSKNWQYNATFAEDGKQKVIMNYADGSGRSRQTITQNNSDHTTIVGQTLYDFTGRPAVTILPTPLPAPSCATVNAQNAYNYLPTLNTASYSLGPFSKYHFELDQSPGSCASINYPLVNTSGAGRYYSSGNPDQSNQQGFVPDAGGFPYSQTEYTGDNTGRIKRQGGVGPEFQLGGGHETKYFYGAPEQIELDRLFGSEVGDASHYQKNMTIDANGQVSMTYIDMAGKTIATSLAGNAPTNLEAIATQPGAGVLRADMFNKNAKGKSQINLLNAQGDAIEFTKSILVTSINSANTFTYNISTDTLKLSCTPNICFNCVYDFEMKVTDDCGNLIYPNPAINGKKMIGNFSIVNGDTIFTVNCTAPGVSGQSPYTSTITTPALILNPGVYYVTKTLSVNKEARDTYLKAYLDKSMNNCILDISDFETTELNKIIDSVDCYVDCNTCFTKLGTKDDYVAKGRGTEQEWQAVYDNCKELCNMPKTSCDIYLNQLLMDVSPNGQYGNWTNPSDPLSVYNSNNLLPKNVTVNTVPANAIVPNQMAFWKKPSIPNGPSYYLDNLGNRDTIHLTKILQGTTSNIGNYNLAVDMLSHTYTLATNHYYTFPEYLLKVSDFVAKWKSSWAKSLVFFHPEYCYYQDCPNKFGKATLTNTMSSNDYDATLLNTKTFAGAVNKGLILPVGTGYYLDYLNDDPAAGSGYFAPIYTGTLATPITDIYSIYNVSMGALNMHQYVAYLIKCASQVGSNQTNLAGCTTFCETNDNTTSKDQQWNTLKGLYLAEKAKIAATYSDKIRFDASSALCNYYNGCIGKADFDPYTSPLINYSGGAISFATSKYYSSDQPCNMIMKDLYATKVKRFGNINNPQTLDESDASYQMYLQTGKCPNALDLQNLADALAKNLKLQNPLNVNSVPVPEPLQNYPELTLNLYNYFNNLPNPPSNYINYLWKTSIIGANDLKVDIKNSFTNVVAKTITFHPPTVGTINWAQVTRITQLMYTYVAGAIYNFTCIAKEQTGSSFVYRSITGETDIELTGCLFKDVCKSNDLAKQLQSLMSALKTSPSLSGSNMFSGTAVQMGAAGGLTAYGNSLLKVQQTVSGTATSNYAWKNTGACNFELYDYANPGGCKIVIHFLSISPGALSPGIFNTVVSFSNIKSDYQNFFTVEARDANNALVGTVKGEIFKSCSGTQTGLSMGDCGKPDPAECQTAYHQNQKDLEILLKDIILNQKYIAGNNNVMANSNLSNNLISGFTPMATNIPAVLYSSTNSYYRYLGQEFIANTPNIVNDSVAFTFKSPCVPYGGDNTGRYSGGGTNGTPGVDCEETTYCTVWFKSNYKSSPPPSWAGLNNIVNVQGIHGYGNTTSSGSYTDFYIVVNYAVTAATGGKQPKDTLYGSSCFEIQNCNSCGARKTSCCGDISAGSGARMAATTGKSLDQKTLVALASGNATVDSTAFMYSRYTETLTQLNKKMGWTKDEPEYISPVNITQLRTSEYKDVESYYLDYISQFDPKTSNTDYLKNVATFIDNYPPLKTPEYAYEFYKKAVTRYNWKADVLSANKIAPLSDTVFNSNNYAADVINYKNYLEKSTPTINSELLSLSSFAQQSRLSSSSTNASTPDHCDSLYAEYLNAYDYFLASHPNYTPPYKYTLFEFQNQLKFCCKPTGYLYFTQYISSFYKNNTYPAISTSTPAPCDPPNTDDCETRYNNYVFALNEFNVSGYAQGNSFALNNPFTSWEEFASLGYCDCILDYINYLNNYISNVPKGLTPPAKVMDFSGCGKTSYCDEVYDNYVDATTAYSNFITHSSLPPLPVVYIASAFTKNGYCYCAEAYNSFLNGIVNGSITDLTYINDHIDISTFCAPVSLDCAQPSPLDTVQSPLYPGTAQDPCTKYKKELAKINAKLLYGQYVEAQSSIFISQYNKRCLGVTENLYRDYADQEFHYTLYYYDQAGNLIKTIPPAGLDQNFYNSIKKYSDANAVKVRNDRSSRGKSVMVDHALASNYVYNSLNQLIKQKIPDHDGVLSSAFKYKYSYGTDTTTDIISSQVIDQNTGYIAGNELIPASTFFSLGYKRGKVFTSHDACDNWQRVPNISGSDLKKIQMIDVGTNVYGFAVGSDGTFMFSLDAGSTWDQFPLPEESFGNNFNDVKALYNNTDLEAVLVGEKGTCVKVRFSPSLAATTATFNQISSGFFGATDNITDVSGAVLSGGVFEYYISVLNTSNQSSKIYSRTSSATQWTDITGTQVLDLNKIRFFKGTKDGYAVGKDGTLVKSTNNSTNWYLQKTGTFGNIKDVYFSTVNIGIAVIEDNTGAGKLYKTSNGGASWDLVDQNSANNYKTLSPYSFSSTLDRVAANGAGGLVKRVTIDYANSLNPAIGAVTTSVNVSSPPQINDVAVVPYDNTNRWFAIAAANTGDIFYTTDFGLNNVTWSLAVNVGGNPKKIVANIINPTGPTFNVEALVLKDGSTPTTAVPAFIKNLTGTPFTIGNLNQSVTWSSGNLTPWASFPNLTLADLSYDLHSTSINPYSKAYLIGYDNVASTCRLAAINLSGLSASSPIVLYNNTAALNKNLKTVAINYDQGCGLAVNTNGELITISKSGQLTTPGPINYAIKTGLVTPSKINDIQAYQGQLIVMGDDGFCAQTAMPYASPFQLVETKTNLNFNAFSYYNSGNSKMMIVCDKGIVCDIQALNFSGSAVNYTISTENLNDFTFGTVPGSSSPPINPAYFVGENATAIHTDLNLFLNNTGTSPLPAVFTKIDLNTESHIKTVGFDRTSGMAICAGDNNQSFNLGGASSLQNTNWFTNEVSQLHFTDADNGYLVGKRGLIKHTSDGGASWRTIKPYTIPSTNIAPDLYSVYTTVQDTAIIGGAYSYVGNIRNKTVDPPLMLSTVATYIVHDIDLFDETKGVAVGTKYTPTSATASLLTLSNNTVTSAFTSLTGVAGLTGNIGLKSVYAFKNSQPYKFMAVGVNATVKYYDGTNCNTTINWSPAPFFQSADNVNAIAFADNSDGFLGGANSKLGSISVDLTTGQITISDKSTANTNGTNNSNLFVINTLSIVDDGGITGFMAGNFSNSYKYNWKFGQERGKYSDYFWYDKLGRMVLSQNAKQAPDKYSYTLYDALGRIIEVGQKNENTAGNKTFASIFGTYINNALNTSAIDDVNFATWLNDASGARTELTKTFYDIQIFNGITAPALPNGFVQENLRKRVASSLYQAVYGTANYDHATHYSYDVLGNVKVLIQDNYKMSPVSPYANRYKFMYYDYDQISGKVNRVSYQPGQPDAFYHDYDYDADNRLTEVKTSRDGVVWESDAKYFYYKHGPLSRVEYGHDKVQGQDYAYTLQGWLKGVNSNKLSPATDIGGDATTGGANSLFARDATGFTLGYYKTANEDYTPIKSSAWISGNRFEAFIGSSSAPTILFSNRENLFNGNISSMATTISRPDAAYSGALAPGYVTPVKPMANAYKYDQLNRLTKSYSFKNFFAGHNDWTLTNTAVYTNTFVYDANGNIKKQAKADSLNSFFDDLTYNYTVDAQGRPKNNRLTEVTDTKGMNVSANDLDPQISNNYSYDAIGNLKSDISENIGLFGGTVEWTIYGKIKAVNRDPGYGNSKKSLQFDYDAQGNRVAKHVYTNLGVWEKSIYYVRDAQGNLMAEYEKYTVGASQYFTLKERPIYGSNRIGMDRHQLELVGYTPPGSMTPKNNNRFSGNKHFELSNHLGNINTVVSDMKIPVPISGNTSINYFVPDIVNATDYYAFGQPMDGRNYDNADYRYGFNGKEKDDEVKGNANSVDFGARAYDPRLGRWLSVDPLMTKYPSLTPYNFAGDMPIIVVDPDGRDIIFINQKVGEKEDPKITKQNFEDIINILYSTAKGRELLEKYIDNPEKTIYIAIGDIKSSKDGPGSLGTTNSAWGRKNNGPKETVPFTKALVKENNADGALDEFANADLREDGKSFLVILDTKYSDKNIDFYEGKGGSGLKGGSKALAHEIGAHVDNAPESYEGEGHSKWGQDFYRNKFDAGSGDAKEANEQVNKVPNGTYSKNLKLVGTGKEGAYKVTKK